MLQNHGEPAWQGKTYNALKDKKHLTGINKEEVFERGLLDMTTALHFKTRGLVHDYRS
jgi:hypothetical protein